jgi:hypothetical protein
MDTAIQFEAIQRSFYQGRLPATIQQAQQGQILPEQTVHSLFLCILADVCEMKTPSPFPMNIRDGSVRTQTTSWQTITLLFCSFAKKSVE